MNLKNMYLIVCLYLFLYGCVTPPSQKNISDPATSFQTNQVSASLPSAIPRPDDQSEADLTADEDAVTDDNYDDTDEMPDGTASPEEAHHNIQRALDKALSYCQASQDFWQQGEIDQALDALDQAYALILNAAPEEEDAKLMRQKEDLRFTISKRILEIYASRNITAKGKHDAIPLDMNKHVREEIAMLSKGKSFINAYKRSGKYRPAIVRELRKAGLPAELSWLPLIESGFNPHALSPARALGLWQFIPSTGYKFGLKRNRYVDERLDPEKSTKAAIAYLKELHEIFGDWATVLAAYNCGEGRVLRVIRSQKVNYLDNFWDLYEKLPRETARYVPRFLATLHMVNNPEQYGLKNVQPDMPPAYETLTVSRQVKLDHIAQATGICPSVLKELNPELRKKILPPGRYPLRVPTDKGEILLSKLDKIPVSQLANRVASRSASKRASRRVVYHRVKKGETLSQIAKRYHTTTSEIMRLNKMHKRHYIVAGNILKIQQKGSAKATGKKRYKTKRRGISTHIVKKGDSLWNIARKYGISTKDIHRVNRLSGNRLSIGQVLKIPGRSSSSGKSRITSRLRTYRVRNGDVPLEIAKRYNMSLERFLRVNRLSRHSKIYPGQKLYVE